MKALHPRSQNERLLGHFMRGWTITTMTAFKRYGICRLSERVRELKKRGHVIRGEWERKNGATFMRYYLERTH